jgi:hypothetical protein
VRWDRREEANMYRLAMNAFRDVLRRRQSKYGKLLEWIEGRIQRLRTKEAAMCGRMEGVLSKASKAID